MNGKEKRRISGRIIIFMLMFALGISMTSCGQKEVSGKEEKTQAKVIPESEQKDAYFMYLTTDPIAVDVESKDRVKFILITNRQGKYGLYSTGKMIKTGSDKDKIPPYGMFDMRNALADFTKGGSDDIPKEYDGPLPKEGYVYTAQVRIDREANGEMAFYAGNEDMYCKTFVHIADMKLVNDVKNKNIKKINSIYIKAYGDYLVKISETLDNGQKEAAYYDDAEKARKKVCKKLDKIADKLERQGFIIKKIKNKAAYTIIWSDGDKSGWAFSLDKIEPKQTIKVKVDSKKKS